MDADDSDRTGDNCPDGGNIVYRHRVITRVWHWTNALTVFVMLMSGMMIFNAPLSVGHGAPIRLRVERQLGYKQAKYVMAVEAVAGLGDIGDGKGGYWEDSADYQWFGGI